MIRLSELQYYVIPGEKVAPEHRHIHAEAYRMWKETWSQTFLEVDGNGKVYADNFSRQSNIGALFRGDECVAMTVQHEIDFNEPTASEDSYFMAWPPEALDQLTKDGKKVLVCSHLTVAQNHRGEIAPDLTYKLLVVDLAVRILLESDCDVMTGTMRNKKGAQKTAYATGATPILKDASHHGEQNDLVGFYKQTIKANPQFLTNMWTNSLWKSRIDLRAPANIHAAGRPRTKKIG